MVQIMLSPEENQTIIDWSKEVGLIPEKKEQYSLQLLYTAILQDFIEQITKNQELEQ